MSFATRTAADVTAEILMSRTAFEGTLLVLEGGDDAKFWQPRKVVACQLVLAGGKPTAIKAVFDATNLKQVGTLAIVDDDYDICNGLVGEHSEHVIRTDTRDIESMLLKSAALERLLIEVGEASKIDAVERTESRSIRDALISRSRIFGEIRYLNALHRWLVDFDQLRPFRLAQIYLTNPNGAARVVM